MRPSKPWLLMAGTLMLSLSAGAQTVRLNEGYSAERLRFAIGREAMLDVESPALRDGLTWDVALALGYARNPVVLTRNEDKTRVGSLLRDRLTTTVFGGFSIGARVQIGLELPVILLNERPNAPIEGVITAPLPSIGGGGLGDLRLVPKVGLLKQSTSGFDLALLVPVTLPTGGGARYLGMPGVGVGPELAIGKPVGLVRLAVNVGAVFRTVKPVALDQRIDHELTVRLGAAYRFNLNNPNALPLELGATLLVGTSLERPFASANLNPIELKGYAAYELHNLVQAFAGVGAGLLRGYGVPDFRAFAGLKISPGAPPKAPEPLIVDSDRDGIVDQSDQCPNEPEDFDYFKDGDGCPELDNDEDGVSDATDRCRDIPGVVENGGCPDSDGDHDGVPDRIDRCPGDPEDLDAFEDEDGCPDPDNDKDGVPDIIDRCPHQPGTKAAGGCPNKNAPKTERRAPKTLRTAGIEHARLRDVRAGQ